MDCWHSDRDIPTQCSPRPGDPPILFGILDFKAIQSI